MRLATLGLSLLMASVCLDAQEPSPVTVALPMPEVTAPSATPVPVEFSQLKVRNRTTAPTYPVLAWLSGTQGIVTVRLTIDTKGHPESAEAIEGPAFLRPVAEGYLKRWAFEPVIQDGKLVRVQCLKSMPFRIKGEWASGDMSPIEDVVLQIEALPTALAVPVDLQAIETQTKTWLASMGLRCVDAGVANQARTLFLGVEIEAFQTRTGTYVCNVMERCSLLSDSKLRENEPDKPQRVFFAHRVVGQKGEQGFQETLLKALRQAQQAFVFPSDTLAANEEWDRLLLATKPATPAGEGRFASVHFDFSQITIKKQPAAPPYPAFAKSRGIQGTVIVVITIDKEGHPIHVEAKSGPAELLLTAIHYALQWEFEPAKLNGVPQMARFKLTMPFRLRENPFAGRTNLVR